MFSACSAGPCSVDLGQIAFLVDSPGQPTRSCVATVQTGHVECPEALAASFVGPASPDGSRLLTVTPGPSGDLLGTWSPGMTEVQFLAGPGSPLREPMWSTDGENVVFRGELAGRTGVWRVVSTGGPPWQASRAPEGDFEPHMTADGHIVFASSRDGNAEIYTVFGDGQPERVTTHPADDLRPRWSADGQSLAWLSDVGEHRRVMVKLDDNAARMLDSGDADQLEFSWSPRSDQIAVLEKESTHLTLRIRALDGSEVSTLDFNADLVEPTWSPQGDHVAWTSRSATGSTIRWATADGRVSDVVIAMPDADAWLPRWLGTPVR
ncbi:MAG: Tol biopolymer transport system component [Myxococcota bacterium]